MLETFEMRCRRFAAQEWARKAGVITPPKNTPEDGEPLRHEHLQMLQDSPRILITGPGRMLVHPPAGPKVRVRHNLGRGRVEIAGKPIPGLISASITKANNITRVVLEIEGSYAEGQFDHDSGGYLPIQP